MRARIQLVSLCACAVLCCGPAGGAGIPPSPAGSAAGPRAGEVRIVEIECADADEVRQVARGGYDIASRRGLRLTLYVTPDELGALLEAGCGIREIGRDGDPTKDLGAYYSYTEMTNVLWSYAHSHSNICRVSSIGQSVQGRDLLAIKITDNPDIEEIEPEFKYVGTMHGDEKIALEMCMAFIEHLLTNYVAEARISNLVDNTEIWVLPLMNPDGYEANSRYNGHGIDLNRYFPEGGPSFPDFTNNFFDGPAISTNGWEPEVAHVMDWSMNQRFVLSANFHGGSLVVNYPYDTDGLGSEVDSPTPDDLLFEEVSRRYSTNNLPMWNSFEFADGIVNGAYWYSIDGGMQDWNYRYMSCNEVTVELSYEKTPAAAALPQYWDENREAMLAYVETVHWGVRGVITEVSTKGALSAAVEVAANGQPVFSDPDQGDYYRMLLPGTYALSFRAPGYWTNTVSNVVVEAEQPTELDVQLCPLSEPDTDGDGRPDPLDLDDDNDGMPDEWEILYDLDPLTDDADGDEDGDRALNLHEYVAGTVPTNDRSCLRITAGTLIDGDDMVLTWSSVSNRTYSLARASNVLVTFTVFTNALEATPPGNTYTDSVPGAASFFYRVGARTP